MTFRDQKLICQECGRTFYFTVTEQRRLAERTTEEAVVPPEQCPDCRGQAPIPAPVAEVSARKHTVERTELPASSRARAAPADAEFPFEEEGVKVKLIGTVKWFSVDKGYGFITKADGRDIFFHRADVLERPLSRISEDRQVEFQLRQTDKGQEAFNVSILPEP